MFEATRMEAAGIGALETESSFLSAEWDYLLPLIIALFACLAAYYYYSSPKGNATKIPDERPATKPLAGQSKPTKKAEPEKGVPLNILWGSQTGTAEDFTAQLMTEARKYGFAPQSIDLEEYSDDLVKQGTVIFVVATYGEGEPTDNAKEFYSWLMSGERESDELNDVQFTVFGLGNRTYEHYNAVGRNIDRRLEELSAHRFYERGEGDDDSSLEEDFAKWKKGLWKPLCALHKLPYESPHEGNNYEVKPRNDFVFVDHDSEEGKRALRRLQENGHAVGTVIRGAHDIKNPLICEVVVNRELHGPTSDRSCRHIEIAVPENITYEPGDHVGVFPNNDPDLVLALARRLGVEESLDKLIALSPTSLTRSLSSSAAKVKYALGPVTLRQALSELVDISSPPRKSLLHALVQYARSEQDISALKALAGEDQPSLDPSLQYAKWIKEDRRTIGEVLDALPSVEVPVGHLLELLPTLAPRYYSISSSPLAHPGQIHITCVITRFTTNTGRVHNGVCSTHFLRLLPSDKQENNPTVPLFVRKSQFRLPKSLSAPLIMVGPGTGIAPFRGFIHHRKYLREDNETKRGEAMLFFGCRERVKDYLYESELNEVASAGHLSLFVAFSREQAQKLYVQDHLLQQKELVWRLLENNGYFYICGDASQMAPAVRATLVDIIAERYENNKEQAEAYLTRLQEQGRWATDVWH